MKELYNDLEQYKSKLIAENKDEAKSQSSDEFRRIIAESMEEGYGEEDGMEEGDAPYSGDHDEEMEAPGDKFDKTIKELEEELGLHEEDDSYGEDYTDEGQMQSEGDMEGESEEEESEEFALGEEDGSESDDEAAVKQAIADLTEMDEMESISEEDDLAKEIEAALAQAEGGSDEMDGEDSEEEDGEMDEIAKMQMEADQILDEISEDVEAELAKKLEKDEFESDEEEDEPMDENMVTNYTNGKGENKKPQPEFAHDHPHLMRNDALDKVKAKYESKIAKLTKLAEAQNKQLKSTAETAKKLAVFNENLMGITRLMIENAMTSKQKRSVVEQVMSSDPKTIQESKALINTIKQGLLAESKTKTPSTNASANKNKGSEKMLKESKAYEDPIFNRMVELSKYDYKK